MGARRWVILAFRIALSGVMLWFLLTKIGDSRSPDLPEWNRSTALWLAGAMLLTLAGIVLSAARWQAVLAAMGQHTRFGRLLSHYLAGQFVANVLPTTIGGDVLRVSRLTRDSGAGPTSFASVVLERLTGWVVLPVMTFVGFLVNPGLRHLGRATQVAISLAAGTLVLLALVVLAVASHRYGDVDAEKGWRRFLAAVSMGLDQLRRHPSQAASVLAGRPRLPARAGRRGGDGGPGPGHRRRRPHRAAGLLPRRSRSPRCCRSASPGSACARASSRSSSGPSASRPSRRSPSACCSTC